jgi:16S rRNA (cytosine1402-N4)-methyltransferase
MVDRVLEWLRPLDGSTIVDATFGGGGHTAAILAALPHARVVALDRDPDAQMAAAALGPRLAFHLTDFRHLADVLTEEGIDDLDGAVFDLGVSSHQLDVGERGFSYRRRGPLDMRMGPDASLTAAEVVNEWPEADLADVIRRYGEERHARRIAAAIVAARPVTDTAQLADVVAGAMPARARDHGHPARRTFQGIRIAVNDELAALSEALDVAVRMLRSGGRLVVISYHSLEDRITKHRFAAGATGCVCPPDFPVCVCGGTAELRLLTRHPERPSEAEVAANPRARTARLRAAEKV